MKARMANAARRAQGFSKDRAAKAVTIHNRVLRINCVAIGPNMEDGICAGQSSYSCAIRQCQILRSLIKSGNSGT